MLNLSTNTWQIVPSLTLFHFKLDEVFHSTILCCCSTLPYLSSTFCGLVCPSSTLWGSSSTFSLCWLILTNSIHHSLTIHVMRVDIHPNLTLWALWPPFNSTTLVSSKWFARVIHVTWLKLFYQEASFEFHVWTQWYMFDFGFIFITQSSPSSLHFKSCIFLESKCPKRKQSSYIAIIWDRKLLG